MSKYLAFLLSLFLLVTACESEEYLSPDLKNPSLLPDTEDYLTEDYKTQSLASEISGDYESDIGLVYYDDETRSIPLLYLTHGKKSIHLRSLRSGAVELSFEDFNTAFMPLRLSAKLKVLLRLKEDTIFMRGTDGVIRTDNPNGLIGTPLPESDDGELEGYYLRHEKKMILLLDLMLPMPVKAKIKGNKQD